MSKRRLGGKEDVDGAFGRKQKPLEKKRRGYKPYTLADYKKHNKPVELGKLPPDLQTPELVAKREKARKVKEVSGAKTKNLSTRQ